ncbi:hypothetical protein L1274_001236 [Duganella sp. HSC-15S17]|uniref:Uncharacterized protein n=1 Tax=Duganella violaceipulchra TaxID=2849652 RepID=A0ABT1GFL9_9BURK|nr:hypothetical protein [Duganella violaceicalia]
MMHGMIKVKNNNYQKKTFAIIAATYMYHQHHFSPVMSVTPLSPAALDLFFVTSRAG